MLRVFFVVACAVVLTACMPIERLFAPKAELVSNTWRQMADTPGTEPDYAEFDTFLARYHVLSNDGRARVRYADVSDTDHTGLAQFVTNLQNVDPITLNRDQQLAYWINLYNAQTIRVILDHYPVDSIRSIGDDLLGLGPWADKALTVNGVALSLNDIEHGIVRPVFDDARIHYALNCAAGGCPNLAARAWRADGLDAALNAAQTAYVNDPRGVTVTDDGDVIVSKIYGWFREDFGGTEDSVLAHLTAHAAPALKTALQTRGRIDGYAYDWSLNSASTQRANVTQ